MDCALDKDGNRVYAEEGEYSDCVCPACGSPVIQRRGDTNKHHFAHDPRKRNKEECPYDYNEDYKNMSDWHIRMQGYFPKEEREHIFTDIRTGKKHIADVYIKECNTVLEFQYSSIKKKEFLDRTFFHLNEGRRIAWVFDESWKDKADISTKGYYKNGKLAKDYSKRNRGPYCSKSYNWLYRRKCIDDGPDIYQPNFCISVFTGAEEGDVLHRIIYRDESEIIISLHDITMSSDIDVEEFFFLEDYWREQEPWKSEIKLFEEKNKEPFDIKQVIAQENKEEKKRKGNTIRSEYTGIGTILPKDFPKWSEEQKRRYLEYEDLDIRLKKLRELQERGKR